MKLFAHDSFHSAQVTELATQLLMFVSTTVIGTAAKIVRDTYTRENYLLRHSLKRDVQIKEEEKRHASFLAEHDPLTGLANRLAFARDVDHMLERARRSALLVQILFLDLDGFKPVNDQHGHAVGDRVLKLVADRLRGAINPDQLVARVGGDEFVVALTTSRDDVAAGALAAEQLAAAISAPIELRGRTLHLSASIGIAAYPVDGADADTVLCAADAQMYMVKKQGKGGIAATPGCLRAQLAV